MGNHGEAGVSSERRRSSCSSLFGYQKFRFRVSDHFREISQNIIKKLSFDPPNTPNFPNISNLIINECPLLQIKFNLNDYSTRQEIINVVSFPYSQGTTNTADALLMMQNMFSPALGDRPGVPNYGIVITDGQSNQRNSTFMQAVSARYSMMMSSNGKGCCYSPFVRGIHRWPVDSPPKGAVTRASCFLWCNLRKWLDKQSTCQWFETPWRSHDVIVMAYSYVLNWSAYV